MKQALVTILAAASLALSGCGAATFAVKAPVANQCSSIGLKGCAQLTDGVIDFVNGDKISGEKNLRAAAAGNSPEKIRQFVTVLRPIGASVGGDTGAAVELVASILLGEQPQDGPSLKTVPAVLAQNPASPVAERASLTSSGHAGRVAPNMMVDELRAATERPATAARSVSCGGVFGNDPHCTRSRIFVGPLVVTNVYTSGGCPDELFLSAGRADRPHWFLVGVSGAPMNIAGQFILEDGEELFAGVRSTGATAKDDPKCAITWSGFRPMSVATEVAGR